LNCKNNGGFKGGQYAHIGLEMEKIKKVFWLE
jgi:hypothetical protein